MRFFSRTTAPFAICALLAGVAACAPQTSVASNPEAAPGLLSIANSAYHDTGPVTIAVDADAQEAQGYDPQFAATARAWSIFGLVYETLVSVDESNQFQPELARSWNQVDETTYRFDIDTEARFSNGRTLNVDDVVGSFDRLIAGGSVWSGQMGPIETVSAVDDTTVEIKLSRPYAPLLAALANTPAAILPMEEITAGTIDPVTEMLGTGPFTLETHRQNESWTFAKNPTFRRASDVSITELVIAIAAQETTRQAAIRDGSVSMANFNNVDSMTTLHGRGISTHNQLQSDFYYLLVNSQQQPDGPMGDQDFRLALNAAISRSDIADIALGGLSKPTGITPSNLPGACSPGDLPSRQLSEFDIEQRINDAGYRGEALQLLIYTSEPILGQMAQLIQQQLGDVGITTDIVQLDYASYSERVLTASPGQFDLALGWFAGYGDASMVANWWNPEVAGFTAGFADSHDDLNDLIVEAHTETGPEARQAIFTDLCAAADRYSEMVPLAHRPSIIAVNDSRLSLDLYTNEGYGDFLREVPFARLAEGI